jgi:hypothetical protein
VSVSVGCCVLTSVKFMYCVRSYEFMFSSGTIPQYHIDKKFADRRYKVQSARTYFYLNEAQCERNLEIFHECLEAVSGKREEHQVFNILMKSLCVLSNTLVHSQPHILC